MHLITGYSGRAHITSANDGAVNAHVFGRGSYIFNSRDKFRADIVSNNIIDINSGEGLFNGRYFEIENEAVDEAIIENGTAGMSRIDLIVARYEKNIESGIETMTIATIKGVPGTVPEVPAYNTGNILDGVGIADFPLYKVTISGLTVTNVEQLFTIRNDIVSDVATDNAATREAVAESNAATVAAVQSSNLITKEEIKADNAQTVTSITESNATTKADIEADNAQTVADVEASNAQTVAEVAALVDGVSTYELLWENPSPETAFSGAITHPSTTEYKYIELIYKVIDNADWLPSGKQLEHYSTGKLPLIAYSKGKKAYTRLSVFKNDFDGDAPSIKFLQTDVLVADTTTTVSNYHAKNLWIEYNRVHIGEYTINEPFLISGGEGDASEIVITHILAYK